MSHGIKASLRFERRAALMGAIVHIATQARGGGHLPPLAGRRRRGARAPPPLSSPCAAIRPRKCTPAPLHLLRCTCSAAPLHHCNQGRSALRTSAPASSPPPHTHTTPHHTTPTPTPTPGTQVKVLDASTPLSEALQRLGGCALVLLQFLLPLAAPTLWLRRRTLLVTAIKVAFYSFPL